MRRAPGRPARLATMRALFSEIRAGAHEAVARRLDREPSLVHAIAASPPKKDDGQSTLQVAIKAAQFEIADLLLDRGADATFIDASSLTTWHAPVLHDAIRATVFSSRFGRNRALPGHPPKVEIMNTLDNFDRAFAVLTRVIERGADPPTPRTPSATRPSYAPSSTHGRSSTNRARPSCATTSIGCSRSCATLAPTSSGSTPGSELPPVSTSPENPSRPSSPPPSSRHVVRSCRLPDPTHSEAAAARWVDARSRGTHPNSCPFRCSLTCRGA